MTNLFPTLSYNTRITRGDYTGMLYQKSLSEENAISRVRLLPHRQSWVVPQPAAAPPNTGFPVPAVFMLQRERRCSRPRSGNGRCVGPVRAVHPFAQA